MFLVKPRPILRREISLCTRVDLEVAAHGEQTADAVRRLHLMEEE
jgi:hypothetical protein